MVDINLQLTNEEAITLYDILEKELELNKADFSNRTPEEINTIESVLGTVKEQLIMEIVKEETPLEHDTQFNKDDYIVIDVRTDEGKDRLSWSETRLPEVNEAIFYDPENGWREKGTITGYYFVDEEQWKQNYVAFPLQNETIEKIHIELFDTNQMEKLHERYLYEARTDQELSEKEIGKYIDMEEKIADILDNRYLQLYNKPYKQEEKEVPAFGEDMEFSR